MTNKTIFILSGSHNENSQSRRIANFLAEKIEREFIDYKGDILDLAYDPLPLWKKSLYSKENNDGKHWHSISDRLQKAEGIIVITPEWHGMATSAVKNFLLIAGPKELADKPGLLVGVSTSIGGANPIAELRMNSSKNSFVCYIPDQLIFRNTSKLKLDHNSANDEDVYFQERTTNTLSTYFEYIKALKNVRAAAKRDMKKFGNGM